MEISGLVHVIGQEETVGNNGFTKRLLVVETQEKYPQKVGIDFVQDKTDLIDPYKIGQEVKVSVNVRGNEYNGKYYVNLQGWRIEAISNDQDKVAEASRRIDNAMPPEVDDLPF